MSCAQAPGHRAGGSAAGTGDVLPTMCPEGTACASVQTGHLVNCQEADGTSDNGTEKPPGRNQRIIISPRKTEQHREKRILLFMWLRREQHLNNHHRRNLSYGAHCIGSWGQEGSCACRLKENGEILSIIINAY